MYVCYVGAFFMSSQNCAMRSDLWGASYGVVLAILGVLIDIIFESCSS